MRTRSNQTYLQRVGDGGSPTIPVDEIILSSYQV